MIAGGAPMDCAQPLMAQNTQNPVNSIELAIVPLSALTPSRPMMRFMVAETMRPVAMKRLMLELSQRKPLTSFPAA